MSKPSEEPAPETRQRRDNALLPGASGLQANVERAASVAGASYSLIGAIVLLGGAGYLADHWLGTDPWLLIIGLLLGIVVGFYELVRVVWQRKP
ncbi:MAG: AtpZ/AtpI family protein [Vicinamibacterales bacterium]